MKKLLAANLLLAAAVSTAYPLDLTPREIAPASDGPQVTRHFLQDGSRQLFFRMDERMSVNGNAGLLTFHFSDIESAGMKWSKSPLQPNLAFEEKNAEAYRASARAFLPPDAGAITMDEERVGAIAINDWTSLQYTFSYAVGGVPQRRTVTFVNLNGREQIVIDVGAPADAYEKAYARGYRVLNSLGELKDNNANGPT